MIDFARKKGKPVFIAEATPTISDHTTKFDGDTKTTLLSNPAQAAEAWDKWFVPFFKTIEDNKDIEKAISYINCHWKSHPMWKDNPTFRDIDARLHLNEDISTKWKEKVYTDAFIHSSDDLYNRLWKKINQSSFSKQLSSIKSATTKTPHSNPSGASSITV